MPDLNVITRVRDEARATLREIAQRLADPCTGCAEEDTCDITGCPHLSLKPCETPLGCDFRDHCMGGALCAMLHPELCHDDTQYAQEARDLAEEWAKL